MTQPTIPYFIQYWNLTFQDLYNRDFRMAIMDDEYLPLNDMQMKVLHQQDKLLVTYISIGEVEADRQYWKDAGWSKESPPSWMLDVNPSWGSYRVAFWEEEWQQHIVDRSKALIDKGYDGLLLDVVDVYQVIAEQFPGRNAEQDMIDFVRRISKEVREVNPKAIIIPNNGLTLLDKPAYLEAIDGVAKESTFYSAHRDTVDSPITYKVPDWKEWDLKLIQPVPHPPANKFVLAIEYPVDVAIQREVLKESNDHQFTTFIGTYLLETLPEVNQQYYSEHPFDYKAANFPAAPLSPTWVLLGIFLAVALLALVISITRN